MPTTADIQMMLHRCGLSHNDAATWLRRDLKVVRKWIDGRFEIPADDWQQLVGLCSRQDRAADEALTGLGPTTRPIKLLLARTLEDAQLLGWPCAGAHMAMLRRVLERAPKGVKLVLVHPGDDDAVILPRSDERPRAMTQDYTLEFAFTDFGAFAAEVDFTDLATRWDIERQFAQFTQVSGMRAEMTITEVGIKIVLPERIAHHQETILKGAMQNAINTVVGTLWRVQQRAI